MQKVIRLLMAVVIVSVFSYTYDVNIMRYLAMLQDKLKEEHSWKNLTASLPIGIQFFDTEEFSVKYKNFETHRLFGSNVVNTKLTAKNYKPDGTEHESRKV